LQWLFIILSPFPRVFIQKSQAGIKGCTAPYLQRMITDLVQFIYDRKHLFYSHSCCNERLMASLSAVSVIFTLAICLTSFLEQPQKWFNPLRYIYHNLRFFNHCCFYRCCLPNCVTKTFLSNYFNETRTSPTFTDAPLKH